MIFTHSRCPRNCSLSLESAFHQLRTFSIDTQNQSDLSGRSHHFEEANIKLSVEFLNVVESGSANPHFFGNLLLGVPKMFSSSLDGLPNFSSTADIQI